MVGQASAGQSVDRVSDNHQLQLPSDSPEIVSVAGYHGLPGPPRTNDDVGIDDVGRPGSCQQQACSRRVRSVQRNKVRAYDLVFWSNPPSRSGLRSEPRPSGSGLSIRHRKSEYEYYAKE